MNIKSDCFPVQAQHDLFQDSPQVKRLVVMRAYEVYCHVYSPQEAIITGNCRGGFSRGELIAFLYARSFPKSEWRQRTDEAFENMKV